jgi:2-O-methyltransferase
MLKKIILKLNIEIRFFLRCFNLAIRSDEISKKLIGKYISKEPIILDIGAHIGADSVEMARLWKKASIYSFEPVPIVFDKLVYNTRKYKSIHPVNCAVGDVDGILKMFVSEGESDASSSLMRPKNHLSDHPQTTFNDEIEVQTMKLSTWLNENNIKDIDLLWLDMQGYEKRMLESSFTLLPNIRAIHTEVSTKETYEGVTLYNEFKEWLKGYDFIPVCEAIPEHADMGNVLFINAKFHNK